MHRPTPHEELQIALDDARRLHLPTLLERPDAWSSVVINDVLPIVHRAYCQIRPGLRLCLHEIFPLDDGEEALLHQHVWPIGVRILSGKYRNTIATARPGDTEPTIVTTAYLKPGDVYFMMNPGDWHAVAPDNDEPCVTIMVSGWPFVPPVPERKVEHPLTTMSPSALQRLLTKVKMAL